MTRLPRSLCLFSVLVSLLLAALPVSAQATPSVAVRVMPATIEIPLGQTADVAVEIVEGQDIYGFDLALTFDPATVEIVDADSNQAGVQAALGTFLDSGFVVLNTVNNVSGTLRFAMTQLNPSLPKSGTGTLIVLRLRGRAVNSGTPLTIGNAQLARRDGSVLTPTPISGQVSVVASAGSSPTGTPIPTQGAGTPMPTSPAPTVEPTTGSTVVQPTPASLATGPSATITPVPTNPLATAAPGAPPQNPVASSTPKPLPGNTQGLETPQPTSASTAPPTTKATTTPAAVAAIATSPMSDDNPAASQVVEQPAAPVTGSTRSAPTLLILSGIVGLVGIATVWFVMRRRSN